MSHLSAAVLKALPEAQVGLVATTIVDLRRLVKEAEPAAGSSGSIKASSKGCVSAKATKASDQEPASEPSPTWPVSMQHTVATACG